MPRLIQDVQAALRQGDIELAEKVLAQARTRAPNDGAVRLWGARIAIMRWQIDDAVAELTAALRAPHSGGWTTADVRAEIGELLFRAGRWGESVAHLEAGAAAIGGVQRSAWAKVAAALPPAYEAPALEFAEMPLVGDTPPQLVCASAGRERVFVLDTGATFTTVSQTLATELAVSPRWPAGEAIDGTGRTFTTEVGVLPAFALGGIHIGDQPVLVVEDARLAMVGSSAPLLRPSALVGLDVITRFSLVLDPRRQSVVLQVRRDLPVTRSVPCLWVNDRMLLPVEIEERRLWFALDTGAAESSLTEQGLWCLSGGAKRAEETYRELRGPGGGTVVVRVVRGLTLLVSDARFRDVALPVVEREPTAPFPLHGVLGADLLLRCRTTLAAGRVRLEFG